MSHGLRLRDAVRVVPGRLLLRGESLVSNSRRNREESTVCIPRPNPTGHTSAQLGRLEALVLVIGRTRVKGYGAFTGPSWSLSHI